MGHEGARVPNLSSSCRVASTLPVLRAPHPTAPPTGPQLGGRLGISALGLHTMGQHGPEARPHLSGLTQMGKPSAPMRGGQASRAASGGEHGGATQQKLNCLSSMYVGTFVALIPAFVFYYFARRLERCFKAVSSITFPVRGSLFPRGNVWRPNIENLILATQHKIWPPRLVRMWACMPARALLSASRLRFGGCSCPVVGSGTCLG
jgi:hypothetical protein